MGQGAKNSLLPPFPAPSTPGGTNHPIPHGSPFERGRGGALGLGRLRSRAMLNNNQWLWRPEAAPAGPGGAFGPRGGQFGSGGP